MDEFVFYESLKIAEWKKNRFQIIYDAKLEETIKEFINYVNVNKYGEIDTEKKVVTIHKTSPDLPTTAHNYG